MTSLNNRVIVILGAGGGIGAETARQAASAGAQVVLADIDENAINRLGQELSPEAGRIHAVPTDVTSRDSLEDLVSVTHRIHGGADVLINCAGIVIPGRLEKLSPNAVERQIEVNFLGTVLATQTFLPAFLAQGRGHFIHIASLGGIAPMPGEAVYCGTKFAVRGFCLSLALELKETPVVVSVISPDSVDTEQLLQEAQGDGSSLSFSGPPLDPGEVAAAIVGTIHHPAPEVLVPSLRGVMTRVVNMWPGLMTLLYPVLDQVGNRGMKRFLENRKSRRLAVPGG